jgi:PIN domain nuclease of toxin-antitoxin system
VTVLLDTSVFLWCISGQRAKLSAAALRIVEDININLWLSSVSLWEIAVKVGVGKLDLPNNAEFYRTQMAEFYIEKVLPVEASHALADLALPRYHRDPFDRMLIAQALVEGLPLVTCDQEIRKYPIQILW